jgi:hypothetical protein
MLEVWDELAAQEVPPAWYPHLLARLLARPGTILPR